MLPEVFNFQSKPIRVVLIDGEPWWVAVDVCAVLEIGNPSQALKRLDQDETTLISIEGIPAGQNVVNESGLYALVLGSRKKEAKEFKKWITRDVLPSIRKTGSYGVEKALSDPKQLRALLGNYAERVEALEARVEEMIPKERFHDSVSQAINAQTVQEVAKVLGWGPQKLFAWLRGAGYLMKDNIPYQRYINEGYFKVVERVRYDPKTKEPITYTRTLITGRGLAKLEKLSQRALVLN